MDDNTYKSILKICETVESLVNNIQCTGYDTERQYYKDLADKLIEKIPNFSKEK